MISESIDSEIPQNANLFIADPAASTALQY